MRISLHSLFSRCARQVHAVFLVLPLLLVLTACTERETTDLGAVPADTATVAAADPVYGDNPLENGRHSYTAFCASCHGAEGRGDGPVATALTTPPTDLTRIQQQNGGTFPTDSVYAYIDGRADVQAHGTREMPVWGNIWMEQEGQPVRAEVVQQRINELVEYIRTLQQPAS